jgi:RNA polymerase sigma-70 factor (ECF subfamily)
MKATVIAGPWVSAKQAAPAGDDSAELVRRLGAGDEAALRDVYVEHQHAVRTFANRLINDRDAAEDLVHEVFVALPRAARRFRGDGSLRQFLIAMAVNHARHHVRGAVRRRRAQRGLEVEPLPRSLTPERLVENQRLGAALVAALDQLSLDQRVAFVLCELEGQSSAEAAVVVGTSDVNVRQRLYQARRKLRDLLAPWHSDSERKESLP